MRPFRDFMIWNHIFFVFEIFYSFLLRDYILVFLGTSTTYLSMQRHRHFDTKYNTIEPLVAKSTMLYITCLGLYQFSLHQILVLLCSELVSLFVFYIQRYNYESIHPWLHLTVAFNIHLYLHYSILLTT